MLEARIRKIARGALRSIQGRAIPASVLSVAVVTVAEIERTTGIGERPADRREAAQKLFECFGIGGSVRHRQSEPEPRLTLANAGDQLPISARAEKVAPAEVHRTGFERASVRAIAGGVVAVTASAVEQV